MKVIKTGILIFLAVFVVCPQLLAQNAFDALRFSRQQSGHDAATLALPGFGIANHSGVGSYIENPASLGLLPESTVSFGAGLRRVDESTQFAAFNDDITESKAQIADVSLAYKLPTSRGSFVFGAGYNQIADFNRAVSVNAFNRRSTITDMFNQSDFFGDAAFNAFAIDSVGNSTKSVLRMGEFQGIDQQAEIIESGRLSEVAAFAATEFQKNLFVGVSLGAIVGSYSFNQTFRESDLQNLYDGFNGTFDFNDMINQDNIDADITGFSGRVGLIYKIAPNISVGSSYRFRSNLQVDEDFSTTINTQFDNGDEFEDSFQGANSYDVTIPARFNIGFSVSGLNGFTFSGGLEQVSYSQIELDELGDERFKLSENEFIEDAFKDVWNIKTSMIYQVNSNVQARAGYAYNPSTRENFDDSRQFFSGGLGIGVSQSLTLDIGAQYTTWDDQAVLYQFFPENSADPISEIASEDVSRLNVLVGLRYKF